MATNTRSRTNISEPEEPTQQIHTISTDSTIIRTGTREGQKLNDLPKFRGNRRNRDTFQQNVEVKSYFRNLENYFFNNKINSDAEKRHILYATVDKEHGDGAKVFHAYLKDKLSYEEVVKLIKRAYMSNSERGLPDAMNDLLETATETETGLMEKLVDIRNDVENIIEAYMEDESVKRNGISATTTLLTNTGKQIDLTDLLLNMGLKLYVSWKAHPSVYDTCRGVGPEQQPSELITAIINGTGEHNSRKRRKRIDEELKRQEDTVFEIKDRDAGKKCGKCGKTNHSTKDCKSHINCKYCGKPGHVSKECRKRLRDTLHCNRCDRSGHEEENCYAKTKNKKGRDPKNGQKNEKSKNSKKNRVRAITELEDPDESSDTSSSEEGNQ